MQEEQSGLLVQHVAMDSRHFDAISSQRHNHGIHFVTCQNKIPGDRGLAAAGGWEVDRRGYAHRSDRRNLHSAFHDRVAAWHSKLVNAAVGLALGANEL